MGKEKDRREIIGEKKELGEKKERREKKRMYCRKESLRCFLKKSP